MMHSHKSFVTGLRQAGCVEVSVLCVVMVACLVHATYYLFAGPNDLATDIQSFRETQTAITIFYILKGGPWIDYETPIFGYPWSIPFEFPTYQLIVAALVRQTGISIEAAGRLVSFTFFVATLAPTWLLFRAL